MKMKHEHFQILESAMAASFDAGVMADAPLDWSDMRFRWTWFYKTPIEGQRPEAWMCDFLYPYLNDDHIDTALRRIAKKTL